MNVASHSDSDTVFTTQFDDSERKRLMEEDREAQLGISAILGALIAIGMCLGIFSVWLISKFGF